MYFTVLIENRCICENTKPKPGQREIIRQYVGDPSEIEHENVWLSAEDIYNMSKVLGFEVSDGTIIIL